MANNANNLWAAKYEADDLANTLAGYYEDAEYGPLTEEQTALLTRHLNNVTTAVRVLTNKGN